MEEVDQRYEVRLVTFAALKQPAHLTLNLFGQIPTYEEGDFTLFETGSTARAYRGSIPGRHRTIGRKR